MQTIEKITTDQPRSVRSELHRHVPSKKKRRCIYAPDGQCSAPGMFFEVCKTCPYGYIYCFSDIVKNLFGKIVGSAIRMLGQERNIADIFKDPRDRQ